MHPGLRQSMAVCWGAARADRRAAAIPSSRCIRRCFQPRCFQPRCFQSQSLQVLGQVYVSDRNLDEDLVRSISLPAQDPNAAEVFYRVITGAVLPCHRLSTRFW